MKSYNSIRILQLQKFRLESHSEDLFCFNPKKKYPWLQKWIFKLLARLGCFATKSNEHLTKAKVLEFYPDQILENIREQVLLMRRDFNLEESIVYIGMDEFYKLAGQTRDHLMYNSPIGISVLGMKVVALPWMEGILVVPRKYQSNANEDYYETGYGGRSFSNPSY